MSEEYATRLEILVKARETIKSKKRWCKGSQARDAYGHACNYDHPNASIWCPLGAIFKAADEIAVKSGDNNPMLVGLNVKKAIKILNIRTPDMQHITFFNDSGRTKHKDVVKVFDNAIAAIRRIAS